MTLLPISTSHRRSSMACASKAIRRADRCAISARPCSCRRRRRAGIGRRRSSVVMRRRGCEVGEAFVPTQDLKIQTEGVTMTRFSILTIAALALACPASRAEPVHTQTLTPQQQLALDIYKELV